MGRLAQIKAKWDKKKNEVLTEEEIKNRVSDKHDKQNAKTEYNNPYKKR